MIKQVYIIGKLNPKTGASEDYTYTELAAMFGVKSDTSVRKRADRENWNKDREVRKNADEAALAKRLQEMKAAELPDIVEMRRRLLKGQLAIVTQGLAQLQAGDMEIKPLDLHRASEFIIEQYYVLFGIELEPSTSTQDADVEVNVKVDIGNRHDILRRVTKLISSRGPNNSGSNPIED
jgi:hypothetical protein